jgi:hypothetical protein
MRYMFIGGYKIHYSEKACFMGRRFWDLYQETRPQSALIGS